MAMYNFWIMDFTASGLILLSALCGERRRKNSSRLDVDSQNTSIMSSQELVSFSQFEADTSEPRKTNSLIQYVLLTFTLFAMAAFIVFMIQDYPTLILGLEHIVVIGILILAFMQWIPGKAGFFVGIFFVLLWMASSKTAFRWLINNVIIAIFALLANQFQFRNFAHLQIYLWTAFFYDVVFLSKMNDATWKLFSVSSCTSPQCKVLELNESWELPVVFTVQFADPTTHVILGAGDIVTGSLISNFAMSFFKSFKYLLLTVLSYALAIALLSLVEFDRLFPALVSIVPCCSLALVLCAIFSRKTRRLFSMNTRDIGEKEEDLLLVL